MGYLLGIDVGTSGAKVALFSESGNCMCSHTAEYPMYQPQNGWAEQRPEDWWGAVTEGVQVVTSRVSPAQIAGVGLSGQMHGLVMLDADGQVLRPSIIWCDQRTGAECAEMERLIGRERLIDLTGNPAMTGFTASKILWVRGHEPATYERCRYILLPKDYIRYRLTGEFASEVSDAAGMQLLDIRHRNWSGEVLERLGIERSLLPSMYESPDVTGCVCLRAAEETGLAAGTPVVGGAGDNAAAAIGTGIVRQGGAFTTIGSSAVIYAVSDAPRIDPAGRVHSLCASVPGKWTVMSCTQGAGLSLKWLRDNVCQEVARQAEAEGEPAYVRMDRMAQDIPLGADKLLFLPYLMGERSPHPDPDCRGVFFGLSAIHTNAHLIRAVLEGVAYSQRECLDVFREIGVPVEEMTVVGGGSRSELWRTILRDLYGCPIYTLAADEGGALGAALLAGVGAGVYASVEQAVEVVKKEGPELPDMAKHLDYGPYLGLYCQVYQNLRQSFRDLAAL